MSIKTKNRIHFLFCEQWEESTDKSSHQTQLSMWHKHHIHTLMTWKNFYIHLLTSTVQSAFHRVSCSQKYWWTSDRTVPCTAFRWTPDQFLLTAQKHPVIRNTAVSSGSASTPDTTTAIIVHPWPCFHSWFTCCVSEKRDSNTRTVSTQPLFSVGTQRKSGTQGSEGRGPRWHWPCTWGQYLRGWGESSLTRCGEKRWEGERSWRRKGLKWQRSRRVGLEIYPHVM